MKTGKDIDGELITTKDVRILRDFGIYYPWLKLCSILYISYQIGLNLPYLPETIHNYICYFGGYKLLISTDLKVYFEFNDLKLSEFGENTMINFF